MSAPAVLTKGLNSWRGEINTTFPTRKRDSDGWIGNQAHSVTISGHNPDLTGRAEYKDGDALNEVRSIDVDKDLMNPKFTMEQLIQWLVTLGRAGHYLPFRYFIYRGRIWSKRDGWATRTYNGSNKHEEHAHFSGDYTQTADNWIGKLGLAAYVKKVTTPPPPKPPVKPPAKPSVPVLAHYVLGKRELKAGIKAGDDVAFVQRYAGGKKYFGTIDGIPGKKFTEGVKRFQRIVGFTGKAVDGIVGDNTWAKMGVK